MAACSGFPTCGRTPAASAAGAAGREATAAQPVAKSSVNPMLRNPDKFIPDLVGILSRKALEAFPALLNVLLFSRKTDLLHTDAGGGGEYFGYRVVFRQTVRAHVNLVLIRLVGHLGESGIQILHCWDSLAVPGDRSVKIDHERMYDRLGRRRFCVRIRHVELYGVRLNGNGD